MNQKHILLPCPGIFQPPSLPQNFPFLPTPPPPTYFPPSYLPLPSYLPHLISCSLHLQSLEELMSLSSIVFWRDVDTRLEEGGELNVEGIWRGKNKRSASSQMQKGEKITFSTFLFLLYDLFFFVVFFFFFLFLTRGKLPPFFKFFFLFFYLKRGKFPSFLAFFFSLWFFFSLCFFFLLFEKKKMLGESTWNERAKVKAKNERAKQNLKVSSFLYLHFFSSLWVSVFALFFFFLLKKKKILRESAWNKSAKVKRQKREPKVKGQNKSLKVSSLPFFAYIFFSVGFFFPSTW